MLQNIQSHFKKSFLIIVIQTCFVNVYIVNEKSATRRNNIFLKNFNDHFNELSNRNNDH